VLVIFTCAGLGCGTTIAFGSPVEKLESDIKKKTIRNVIPLRPLI
jgi:hypothetical protein